MGGGGGGGGLLSVTAAGVRRVKDPLLIVGGRRLGTSGWGHPVRASGRILERRRSAGRRGCGGESERGGGARHSGQTLGGGHCLY